RARDRRVLRHARGGARRPPAARPDTSRVRALGAAATGARTHALMPAFRSLLEELSGMMARTFPLGEGAAHGVARISAILGAVLIGWLGYRVLAVVIRRLLRPLEGSTDYPIRAQRARTLGPLLTSVMRYIMAFIVFVVILQQIGIDVGGLLVSA